MSRLEQVKKDIQLLKEEQERIEAEQRTPKLKHGDVVGYPIRIILNKEYDNKLDVFNESGPCDIENPDDWAKTFDYKKLYNIFDGASK